MRAEVEKTEMSQLTINLEAAVMTQEKRRLSVPWTNPPGPDLQANGLAGHSS